MSQEEEELSTLHVPIPIGSLEVSPPTHTKDGLAQSNSFPQVGVGCFIPISTFSLQFSPSVSRYSLFPLPISFLDPLHLAREMGSQALTARSWPSLVSIQLRVSFTLLESLWFISRESQKPKLTKSSLRVSRSKVEGGGGKAASSVARWQRSRLSSQMKSFRAQSNLWIYLAKSSYGRWSWAQGSSLASPQCITQLNPLPSILQTHSCQISSNRIHKCNRNSWRS